MPQTRHHIRGFSIIELMVGIVIAIVASIVMFQVFAFSERQKRTVTGASDAQVNGALAVDTIERETRMAGFGLMDSVLTQCNPETTYSYYGGSGGGGTDSPLMFNIPVTITQGSQGADTITIQVSGADISPDFIPGNTCLRDYMPATSSTIKVTSIQGCPVGSLAILVQSSTASSGTGANRFTTPAGTCTLLQITNNNSSALTVQQNPGQGSYNPPSNPEGWPGYALSAPGTSCESSLVCVGIPSSSMGTVFSIDTTTRSLLRDGVPISPGIMDVQAQYGLIPSGAVSGVLTWQEPTGNWNKPSVGNLTLEQKRQLQAIRIAVIARSGEYEKPQNSNGTCDTTTSTDGLSTWATFDTTNWPADWQCYRYKIFETVIPLRNAIWASR